MSTALYNEFDNLTEAEKREIHDYECNKPMIIENEIKNKNVHLLKDDIFIYASRVESVLDDYKISFGMPESLKNMLKFLELAVESNNLHVLKAVWNYGIEAYFRYKPWESPNILMFVADLICHKDNTPYKTLNFFIKQLKTDNKYCFIKPNDNNNPYSGLKRYMIYSNLLCAAVYNNNIEAINLLLPKQPNKKSNTFVFLAENMYLENIKNFKNIGFNNNMFFTPNFNNKKETLFTDNPTFYTFDTGNTEILEILINAGYEIDFSTADFSFQIANFAHKNIINFLIKNYKEKLANTLDIYEILEASNYPLLRFYTKYKQLKSEYFNKLFVFNDEYQFNKTYKNEKLKNIKKCILEFKKQNIKLNNIDIPLKYSISMNDLELLGMCLNLYCHDSNCIDITNLFPNTYFSKELLEYLNGKTKLICFIDEVKSVMHLTIRNFQYYLKYIEFNFNNSTSINALTKDILNSNSITGVKLLLKNKFITSKNYSEAVDFIVKNDSDKLITTLIANSKEIGGYKKSYDI